MHKMKTQNIKITVIIAVYNGEKHIEDTVKSVISQNMKIDLIIIDGDSDDKTVEIVNRYNNSLYKFVSEKDKGIYDAFNKGWNLAHPDSFILYLGAGDELMQLPSMDSLMKADVVYGKVVINEDRIFRSKTGFVLELGNTLHHQALLVKKGLYPVSPFDIQFSLYADFDFNQRLYRRKVRFLYDDDFLSYALPDGVSANFDSVQSLKIVEKNFGKPHFYLATIYYKLQRLKKIVNI